VDVGVVDGLFGIVIVADDLGCLGGFWNIVVVVTVVGGCCGGVLSGSSRFSL